MWIFKLKPNFVRQKPYFDDWAAIYANIKFRDAGVRGEDYH